MPELPEVETVRRGLAPFMEGRRIGGVEQRRANLRFPFPHRFKERLTGTTITALSRRAKYLLATLDSGDALIMHLGMSGAFRIAVKDGERPAQHTGQKDERHDHVVLHLDGGGRVIYNDPRRFGFMTLAETDRLEEHPLLRELGVEPLGNRLNAAYLSCAFAGRKTNLKAALMDQKIVAGLGNIYACEALFRARLSPRRNAASLTRADGAPGERGERLAAAIRTIIADAVAAGGSSLRDYVQADGSLGYFQHSFAVYGRDGEPCSAQACSGVIRRIVQSGRSSFYCPNCQR